MSYISFFQLLQIFGISPVFTNLTELEFVVGVCITWSFMFQVLKNCPKLQILLLEMPLNPNEYCLMWFPDRLPESLLFKSCTVTNYVGLKSELQFLQCILRITASLDSVRIKSSPSLESMEKLEMLKELIALPRNSSTCKVYFD
jgi:hypothetical protein